MASAFSNTGQLQFYLFFLAFMVLIIVRRSRQLVNGSKFSMARLLRPPLVYTLLLLMSSLDILFLYIPGIVQITSIMIALLAGIAGGVFFGSRGEVYRQSGEIFFKRSPIIFLAWIVLFATRIFIELIFPDSISLLYIAISLLSFSTGLFYGETLAIYRKYREFTRSDAGVIGE